MEGIRSFLRGEPVAVAAVVSAAITLAVAFGMDVSGEQVAAISAVLTAVSGLFARSAVSPVEVGE